MKRLIMGFAACALLMTSCTEQEIIENVLDGQGELTFSTGVGKQTTKTAELTNSALQEAAETNGVTVYTYQYMGSPTVWSKWFADKVVYDDVLKWHLETSARFRNQNPTKFITYFSTVKDGNDPLLKQVAGTFDDATFTTGEYPQFTYKVNTTSANQEDLIAGITEVKANQTDITLGMRHILSQVNFGTVGYKGANISIRNIKIVGLFNSATYEYGAADTYPIGRWLDFGTDGTKDTRTETYEYYNYGNTTATNNPQPVVKATAERGDIYIFGDGGNWGPGKIENTFYPDRDKQDTWVEGNTMTLPKKLDNSLILMPQDFEGIETAKVSFEYQITDVDGAYVAGNGTDWAKGEFKLDFKTGDDGDEGTHYLAQWDQNYRYVYLIDFTDFLDGNALTFDVDVQAYPWENYNNGGIPGGGDGEVNIMIAGQPTSVNMNTKISNGSTWYIASQSATEPNNAKPYKWAQVVRNEEWDLSVYDFRPIAVPQTFNLSFENVIFNTSDEPSVATATEITLTLPEGFRVTIPTSTTNITVVAAANNTWVISKGDKSADAVITITNNNYYRTSATLKTAIEAATASANFFYGGSEAIDLTKMAPTGLADGEIVTVKFNTIIIPTVSAESNWTWDAASKTATYTEPTPQP